MQMKRWLYILLLMALTSGGACSRKEVVPEPVGRVTLTFRTGGIATRAETPGDGNVADGGGVYATKDGSDILHPDIHIFIFDWDTGVLKKHFGDNGNVRTTPGDADGAVGEDYDYDSENHTSKYMSIGFDFDEEGVYSVYALANINGGDGNLDISLPDLATVTASDLDALVVSLTSGDSPVIGERMPLTAKGKLNVERGIGKYNGYVELELHRCVNQVQFIFRNLTKNELDLYNCQITLKDMNTSQGWLFERDPDFVSLGDGDDAGDLDDNYGNYSSGTKDLTDIPGTDNPATPADEREVTYFANPVRFFPSVAPMQSVPSSGQRYLCDISFQVGGKNKSFTNLPIHTPKSLDITSLKRNQYLQVVTTVAQGENVSFNFKVVEWVTHSATVEFN